MIRMLMHGYARLPRADHRWAFLVVLFLCMKTFELHAAGIEILTPPSGSTVLARNSETHFIFRQPAGEDRRVRVEGTGATLQPKISEADEEHTYFHFLVPLKPGKNVFNVVPGGERIEITFKKVQSALHMKFSENFLFHESGSLPESCQMCHYLTADSEKSVLGLEKQTGCIICHENVVKKGSYQHSTTTNRQCLVCHQHSSDPLKIGFPPVETQEICFTCHSSKRSWLSKRSVHGPFRLGGCTICHDPHSEKNRYQLWAEGSLELCLDCHSDKVSSASQTDPLPYVHGIIFEKGCTACHDPHATDHKFVLHNSTNKMCVGCHPSLSGVFRGHPVANHPVSGPVEKRRKGREFTCASCHDPHGSQYPEMLIETIQRGRLCYVCHNR